MVQSHVKTYNLHLFSLKPLLMDLFRSSCTEMKILLLLRHAKSSWKDEGLSDFDRPLRKRGRKAAPMIGDMMRTRKVRPDLILSSPAVRAKETTRSICKAAGLTTIVRYEEGIYEASARRLLEIVSKVEETANTVVLVGHNPGFEELLTALTSEERDLPTASLACIELSVEKWSQARAGVGHLRWLITPKELQRD